MSRLLRVVAVAASLASLALVAGCGAPDASGGQAGKEIKPVDAGAVPAELLGLSVKQEDSSSYLADIERSYVEKFSLYSIRQGDLLEASMQVSTFTDDAAYQSPSFRGSVVNRIGSSKAQLFRMGDSEVWMTTGTKQQIAIWFKGPHMFVLSVRDDYTKPRALIREAMGIKL